MLELAQRSSLRGMKLLCKACLAALVLLFESSSGLLHTAAVPISGRRAASSFQGLIPFIRPHETTAALVHSTRRSRYSTSAMDPEKSLPSMSTGVGVGLVAAGVALGVVAPTIVKALKGRLSGGTWAKVGKTTSGARTVKDLPVGKNPIQLYSMATPNGQKATIALEEMGFKYDAWFIDILGEDQFTSGFVKINPNSKIPSMVDNEGPGKKPVNVFESGNILLYLAEKSGKFLPKDPAKRVECLNWLFFQVGEGPYFGQYGHFMKFAPVKIPYGINRYKTEVMRALDVLDKQLEGREYICGDYTIVDMAWMPWVRALDVLYKASEVIELSSYKNVAAWRERVEARPAVTKGMKINFWGEGGIKNYSSA